MVMIALSSILLCMHIILAVFDEDRRMAYTSASLMNLNWVISEIALYNLRGV